MRHAAFALLLCASPVCVQAQGTPGTNISINVRVVRGAIRGDTTALEYVLRNDPQSQEELFTFTVDAPSPVLRISAAAPDEWDTGTSYRGRSVADWAALSRQVPPGTESSRLTFEAIGLPGIVTAWVRGYYPPPPLTEADTLPIVSPSDPLVQNSVSIAVVGIEPIPENPTVPPFLNRLRVLTALACDQLAWVTHAGVCRSLHVKLDQAVRSFERGDTEAVRNRLRSFLNELDAQHGPQPGKHVTDNAYWLLKLNAVHLLALLGGS